MTAPASPLLDGVTYPRNKVHAPCWGAYHRHDRAIATCNTCGREVVIYKGRVLNVNPNERGARKFTCWTEAHHCVDPKSHDAQALSDAYYAAKSRLQERTDELCAQVRANGLTFEEQQAALAEMSELKIAVSETGAAARDAGLTWIGWES